MNEKLGVGSIVGVANQKGGVGKTTIAVHLAIGAARRGKRVILVDADPQGNATSWLLDGQQDGGMYRLLILKDAPVKMVAGLRTWGIGLLPGNYETGQALAMLGAIGRLGEIPGRIRPLGEVADLVVMDMPPSRMAGFNELLMACDWVITPTQLERLSLEGVSLMAQAVRELGDRPRLMGVVPNMTRVRTREHQAQMKDLVQTFGGTVWPPLPLTIRVTEAASFGTTVFDLCPGEDVTIAMNAVVTRMLGVLNG
ncbi:MAG: ParA family protein [Anaerolineae bacterium]|nr:ParA family protein [Anaerolineae bacterium]